MSSGRFVVLGLAQARSPWFRSVAQWSNSGSIPVEFLKCMSAVELRAHLGSGRAFSALLVDGSIPALDRDLVEEARTAGCAVLVVDDFRVTRDWLALGANAVVNPMFERKDLVDLLGEHTVQISRGDRVATLADQPTSGSNRARVAAVCGAGGTGASTAAIALAQGLADAGDHSGTVLLADLALHAEQAMLHDARDVVPGVQELVDAHRSARLAAEELRNLTFDVESRGYQLLLGLRRARYWAAIRPRAFAAAFDALTAAWDFVVCDIDAEFEGEDDGGSADVEERHLMARVAVARADAVVVVGSPSMKGIHAMGRVIGELLDHEVPAGRIISAINHGPRSPRIRAGLSSAIAQLLHGRPGATALHTPIYLPERRVDEALRDGVRLPPALSPPLVGAFLAVTQQAAEGRGEQEPRPIQPGSLGHWAADVSPEPA
ncbi:MAG: hypothetical protein M3P34_10380 [Actinomycetota bacterium]|nr:hypothetical protein [Actinomycetota bacterium]